MSYQIEASAMGSTVKVTGESGDEAVDMFVQLMERDTIEFPALTAAERLEEIESQ